jgi:hypothetical protein
VLLIAGVDHHVMFTIKDRKIFGKESKGEYPAEKIPTGTGTAGKIGMYLMLHMKVGR